MSFPDSSAGKESACNAGDPDSIPRSGRYPGEGSGYPLQYSDLENSIDYIVHGVAKRQTWLSDFKKKKNAVNIQDMQPLRLPGLKSLFNISLGLLIPLFTYLNPRPSRLISNITSSRIETNHTSNLFHWISLSHLIQSLACRKDTVGSLSGNCLTTSNARYQVLLVNLDIPLRILAWMITCLVYQLTKMKNKTTERKRKWAGVGSLVTWAVLQETSQL